MHSFCSAASSLDADISNMRSSLVDAIELPRLASGSVRMIRTRWLRMCARQMHCFSCCSAGGPAHVRWPHTLWQVELTSPPRLRHAVGTCSDRGVSGFG